MPAGSQALSVPSERSAPVPAPGARETLLGQARIARKLGSAFVAHVLEAAFRNLDAAPRLAALIDQWPGDPVAAAMAMRLNSALHALARKGEDASLAALYREKRGDFDRAIAQAMAHCEPFILEWMARPTQTNEVGRAAMFMAALIHVDGGAGMPNELLELGASAGLNLNLARYRYSLGGQACGNRRAGFAIAPRWSGPVPPLCPVEVVAARGVDLNPVDLASFEASERMMAYVWPGEVRRARRLASAIAMARIFPPQVEQGSAGAWLDRQLQLPQRPGERRVVMHSMVMQYLSESERHAVMEQLTSAGQRASRACPLVWIALEWKADRSEVLLQVTRWSGEGPDEGVTRTIAACHPYGKWIEWRA